MKVSKVYTILPVVGASRSTRSNGAVAVTTRSSTVATIPFVSVVLISCG
jgi:hypothetical protein